MYHLHKQIWKSHAPDWRYDVVIMAVYLITDKTWYYSIYYNHVVTIHTKEIRKQSSTMYQGIDHNFHTETRDHSQIVMRKALPIFSIIHHCFSLSRYCISEGNSKIDREVSKIIIKKIEEKRQQNSKRPLTKKRFSIRD